MNSKAIPDHLLSNHLFLLVGKNPLPNYVAAKLLTTGTESLIANTKTERKPTLYLVYSEGTKDYKDNIQDVLRDEAFENVEVPVDPSSSKSISNEIAARFPSEGTVGLHYTGGTKAMAVHAYKAIEEELDKRNKRRSESVRAVYSYLDPRTLQMRFDEGDPIPLSKPDDEQYGDCFRRTMISLNDILRLHGLEFRQRAFTNPLPNVWKPDLVKALYAECLDKTSWRRGIGDLIDDCEKQAGYKPPGSRNKNKYETLLRTKKTPLPINAPMTKAALEIEGMVDGGHIDLSKVPEAEGVVARFSDYLHTRWFEDFVLQKILTVKDPAHLRYCGTSLETALSSDPTNRRAFFEIDVVGLRGFQLFAVSCTLDTEPKNCKKKLFEIAWRARQLGGDEARVALVCLANNDGKLLLEEQLTQDNIKVFGANDLPYLDDYFLDWFSDIA